MRCRVHLRWNLVLSCVFAACGDTQAPPKITPVDGRPDDIPPELVREVQALDPRVDSDGDGLQDVDELLGWVIKVDETGRPQGVISRQVTSDPDQADTDLDGLLDGVERMKAALAGGNPAARASEFVVYPGAGHAFHADYRPSYLKAAAEDGWQRCLAWFQRQGAA